MVLSYRKDEYKMPITSSCIIHTDKEDVHDGELISISASVFSSVDFTSGALKTSETLEVPMRLYDGDPVTVFNGQSAILNCFDNDIFNMYVTL